MKKTNKVLSLVLAVIMVVCMLPVSVFAADICSCVDRCNSLNIMDSGCPVCTASGNPADCMGTPILQLNGGVERLSDNKAQIGLSAAVNETVEWKYYYLITANSSENPSAETIIANGKSGIYTDLMYLDITDLAEGVKYIHIVLHQEEQDRTTNALNLTIPEYVPLTIVPSAEGCELDSNNTLTVAVGTTVTFTTSESGCGMEYKEGSKVGPELEFVGEESYTRTATFSEIGTYTIEASIGGKTAECTVVVVDELHQHSYSSEWTKDDVGHWHACNCGDMTDYADHEYEGQDCEDGEKHRLICRYCGFQYRTDNLTSVFDHEYDNECDSSCNGCGYERTVAPHLGTSCDICGWTFAQSAPTNLRWDTSNGTVAVWDAVDGATNYIVKLYKKETISFRLISHVVSDTSFEFDLKSLSPGSYYFTVRATFDDIKSKSATSDNIIMTSGGTPILINGSSERVDYIAGTAYIVDRDDIANGSVSDVNMTPITVSITLTNEQAVELINGWIASWDRYSSVDTYKNYIRPQLEDYSLADLEVIRNNIERGIWPNDFIADVVIEKIESKKATGLVIAPGYIDSTSAFKVTTGQGLGVTYSNDALKALLTSVGTSSNVKVETKFKKAEITRDEARIIVEEWAEIVNTAEGEEQIKNLLTNYSIYELALLQQYTNILILDDSTAQKLYELMRVERDKKKEEAAAKANEEPLATFSVNTYAVTADGTQTYIPVKKSMQYTIPVDTSGIPENAMLALYRVNEDGTRTKQEILSVANGVVIAQTGGNSDYVLVYTVNETETPDSPQTGDNSNMWLWFGLMLASGFALAGSWIYSRKRRTN